MEFTIKEMNAVMQIPEDLQQLIRLRKLKIKLEAI